MSARALAAALALLSPLRASGGYAHSFTWLRPPDFVALQRCAERMRPLVEARAQALHVYAGDELDRFPDQTVLLAFNGRGGEAAAPFVFPGFAAPGEIFQAATATNVCATGRKPYDEVVVAALIVARTCFGPDVLEIRSDGDWERDWARGRALAEAVLGHPAASPLTGGPVRRRAEGGRAGPRWRRVGTAALRGARLLALLAFAGLAARGLARRGLRAR